MKSNNNFFLMYYHKYHKYLIIFIIFISNKILIDLYIFKYNYLNIYNIYCNNYFNYFDVIIYF